MASRTRVLYVGITNNLERRVAEHKIGALRGFTAKYSVSELVYFEETNDVVAAITREKQIKGWLRAKKETLIRSMNPAWSDLSASWFRDDFAENPNLDCHPERSEGSPEPYA